MNTSICKVHGISKTHICLFKDCQKSYRLLCQKCCFHSQHKNKIILLKDLKEKLIKSKPNIFGYGLELRCFEFRSKIKHFRNFRNFILEREKILFQKQKQIIEFVRQLVHEQKIINDSINRLESDSTEQQLNNILKEIGPFINFHGINNKIILGSNNFKKKQQFLHGTVQKGLDCVNNIKEYLIKIIQVLMYQTQLTDLQQQKLATENYGSITEIQSMLQQETIMLQEQIRQKHESLQLMKIGLQTVSNFQRQKTQRKDLQKQLLEIAQKLKILSENNCRLEMQLLDQKQIFNTKIQKLSEDNQKLRKSNLKLRKNAQETLLSEKTIHNQFATAKKKGKLYQSANISQYRTNNQQRSSSQINSQTQFQNIICNYRRQSQQKAHLLKMTIKQKQKILTNVNIKLDLVCKQKQKIYKNMINSEKQLQKNKKIIDQYQLQNSQLKQQNNQLLSLLAKFKGQMQQNRQVIKDYEAKLNQLEQQKLKLQIQLKKKDQVVNLCSKQLALLKRQIEKDMETSSIKKSMYGIKRYYFKQNSQKNNIHQQTIPIFNHEQRKPQLNMSLNMEQMGGKYLSCNTLPIKKLTKNDQKSKTLFENISKDVVSFQSKMKQQSTMYTISEKELGQESYQNNLSNRQLAEIKKNHLILQANRTIRANSYIQ